MISELVWAIWQVGEWEWTKIKNVVKGFLIILGFIHRKTTFKKKNPMFVDEAIVLEHILYNFRS